MELYIAYFAALVLFNVALASYRHQANKRDKEKDSLALPAGDGAAAATKFKIEYFGVYGLVVAADWLQGPYMYALYRHEKDIPESTVAAIFTTGFVTAGVAASFVGGLADKYGRRAACLVFCVTYGASCLSVLSNDIFILFAGRALGGLSTTLLFSAFETWMISEYHKRDLSDCMSLGNMFSSSVTLSGIVAILAGVVGEALVNVTDTKTSSFMLALICLATAFVCIHQIWPENYGEVAGAATSGHQEAGRLLVDRRILALGLTTTVFEGSMYLFVFFWSPALISSRSKADNASPLPFGLIFSCFMCAMMLGSMVWDIAKPSSCREASRMMLHTLSLASYALLIPVLYRAETMTFWSFALFELCVGMYFPTMSRLKSEIVEDGVRAKVYGLMRLPLNVFVVAALGLMRDGDEYRGRVFTAAGALLLCAFLVVQRYLM